MHRRLRDVNNVLRQARLNLHRPAYFRVKAMNDLIVRNWSDDSYWTNSRSLMSSIR